MFRFLDAPQRLHAEGNPKGGKPADESLVEYEASCDRQGQDDEVLGPGRPGGVDHVVADRNDKSLMHDVNRVARLSRPGQQRIDERELVIAIAEKCHDAEPRKDIGTQCISRGAVANDVRHEHRY